MKQAKFFPRLLILFLVFLALVFAMFRFASHHYKNVAQWGVADSREVLMYEGEVYCFAGEIGDPGLGSKKFPRSLTWGILRFFCYAFCVDFWGHAHNFFEFFELWF